jgi:hypothetical protein
MKKKDAVFKELARTISDEDIRFVCFRLQERKSGDVGDVVEYLQTHPEVDRVFATTKDANGIYDLLEEVHENLDREIVRRMRVSGN